MKLREIINLKKKAVIIGILIVMTVGSAAVYAASTPGSEDDPVVTQSYVDNAIQAALANSGGSSGTDNPGSAASGTGTYKVVELDAGQSLIGNEGTEIILRSGSAKAIDNGENGISDMTAGKDLRTGDTVQANHLLLTPRSDGRGVKVSTEAYLMVRGTYTLQ